MDPTNTNSVRGPLIGAAATVLAALIGLSGLWFLRSPTPAPNLAPTPTPTPALVVPIDSNPKTKLVLLVDSAARRGVSENLSSVLDDSQIPGQFDPWLIYNDWLKECSKMRARQPALIVAHFHALRKVVSGDDAKQEESLLTGLHQIASNDSQVKFLIYSRSFEIDSSFGDKLVSAAIDRLISSDTSQRPAYDDLRTRIKTIRWPQNPQQTDRSRLIDCVKEMLK